MPSLCAVCRGWGRGRICGDCVARFAPRIRRCSGCALEVPSGAAAADGTGLCGACLSEPPPYERTSAAVTYGYPWDRLIGNLKFHGALDLAPALVRLMLDSPHALASAQAVDRTTILLPVPLSRQRLRERGFNQAWELARRLARSLALEADARLLLRVKDAPHQLALPPAERAANVRGVFAVEPMRRAELQGRDVLLVDDVMTTGATAAEISRVLLLAGAARVAVWVVARTPRPGAD